MSTDRPTPKLPPGQARLLVVGVLAAWIVLGVLGWFVGRALGPPGKTLIAGALGVVFASIVWMIGCRILAVVLRTRLDRGVSERGTS